MVFFILHVLLSLAAYIDTCYLLYSASTEANADSSAAAQRCF
eukprot:COSAG06_NODE_35133_length_464_cov_0.564384_1_plen_41_part_10